MGVKQGGKIRVIGRLTRKNWFVHTFVYTPKPALPVDEECGVVCDDFWKVRVGIGQGRTGIVAWGCC